MSSEDIAYLGLMAAGRAIACGELCPLDYTDALLSRIEALDGRVHAFVHVDGDRARYRARLLRDRRRSASTVSNEELPPLFGVPYAVKDIIDVAGLPTSAHSRVMSLDPKRRSADIVEALDAAGGVMLGKLSLYEFAIGGPTFDLPWPPARNPWNLDYMAGSSSSGSGAALAAGFVPLTIGTDTGGSIRSPAAMNGVVGLKPTYGSLSTRGVFPLASSLDTVGPLARSVEDVAYAFATMCGEKPNPEPFDVGLEGIKIGVIRHFYEDDLDASEIVVQAIDTSLKDMQRRGARLVDLRLSPLSCYNAAGWITLLAEGYATHEAWLRSRSEEYGSHARETLLGGAFITAAEYLKAQCLRAILSSEVDQALDTVDILVTAVSALPPCRIDDKEALARLASASVRMPFNATGHPALAVPVGLSREGLPIGIQFMGRKGKERSLLKLSGFLSMTSPLNFLSVSLPAVS
jgi:aspartyl-tRNA(Asn)/glutamyl-tRNA(Gln) amidotransferase subunit A